MTNDRIVKNKRTLHRKPTPEEYGIQLKKKPDQYGKDSNNREKTGKPFKWGAVILAVIIVSWTMGYVSRGISLKSKSDSIGLSENTSQPVSESNDDSYDSDESFSGWEEVILASEDGTYDQKYQIGDTMTLDLGHEGTITMELVAKDADDLADGSGKAHMTWISREVLNTERRMNPPNYNGQEGTGSIGGWEKCEMRTYLREEIMPLLPQELQEAIKKVKKYSNSSDNKGKIFESETTDTLWIPSQQEIFGTEDTSGVYYKDYFLESSTHIKYKMDTSGASWWWLRSACTSYYFWYVDTSGDSRYYDAYPEGGVVIGFCL